MSLKVTKSKQKQTKTKHQSSQMEPSGWEISSPPPPTFLLEFLHTQGGTRTTPHTHTT